MRPDKDVYFLQMAKLVATRSTCFRRQVGGVLVSRLGHVLATGYNGVPRGFTHCNQHDPFDATGFPHACEGALAKSGTRLDECLATHAEMNMLLQCRDVQEIETAYCTTEPCVTCTKLLLNTSCQRVVWLGPYSLAGGRMLWAKGRAPGTWLQGTID